MSSSGGPLTIADEYRFGACAGGSDGRADDSRLAYRVQGPPVGSAPREESAATESACAADPETGPEGRQRGVVLAKTAGRCHICGSEVPPGKWDADHVLAHSSGGAHAADNYQNVDGVLHRPKLCQEGKKRAGSQKK